MGDPRVGIGLPTHNGERYLRESLDALLAQDYPNFRLLISDNASTDGTADICREAAGADERVTYRRLDRNIGAVANFRTVFESTSGPYFMWAGDDDRWDPSYVRRCVEALEANDGAVMASTGLRFIDEAGDILDRDYAIYDNPDLSSESVTERVGALVRRGGWYQVYGLARRDALERVRQLSDVYGWDVVLLMELALMGPIVKVPEVLYWFRQYEARTEEDRVRRQGHVSDDGRIMRAKYTHLQESLTGAVAASGLPWRRRSALTLDILRAAYLEDTPMSRHARKELTTRVRFAVSDKDVAGFVKFALLDGAVRAERFAGRARRRARQFEAHTRR